MGHEAGQIGRITCPMGDPGLGKHPQMIAVGVAAQLLHPAKQQFIRKDRRA
jgi:xanthine dehydrogenase accessory factor